nr:aldehyde dehydrogenase family protein [Amycolatopsis thailandensis]
MTEFPFGTEFYIDGKWIEPTSTTTADVVDPATERTIARVRLAGAEDVDRAVAAAKSAFPTWSRTDPRERSALLRRISEVYRRRSPELSAAITAEMGAPVKLAGKAQVPAGLGHVLTGIEVLDDYPFERLRGSTVIRREPVGVCALITPWNWPLNQILCKVVPALATGCTMVLKPSERAPLSASLLAEILAEAGVPDGVFNLVHGDGPGAGTLLAKHADVDMVSFTGSTHVGVLVSRNAAGTIKRVSLELGGKSANVVLPDADLPAAVRTVVDGCFRNTGQSCNATTRVLVQHDQAAELISLLEKAVEAISVGDPRSPGTELGPVGNKAQFEKVQALIWSGIEEGARLVTGGLGAPDGLDLGFFVKPTVFADVTPDMRIAREEIFGPVLAVLTYEDEEDAIRIANDSDYGLSGAVQSADPEHALAVARRIRTGMVGVNGAGSDLHAPFGGYGQSGNGREWGEYGFDEYTELKAILGAVAHD